MSQKDKHLTVAVTGPTGTFGFGLMPLLEVNQRIEKVVGIARRAFDPAEHGWSKMEYRQGDVRNRRSLDEAFAGADVVVHLAFSITGAGLSRDEIRDINVKGTLNTFRAAADSGAKRFVYASSVAAYGFHSDNPPELTEDWPTRPADHLFYAQEKAEIEDLLREESKAHPELELYVLRPPVVLGPNAGGSKQMLPGPLAMLPAALFGLVKASPVPVPAPAPDLPLQFIHEDDVGQALLLCITGEGPPGAYNIAGDGVLSVADVARELNLAPVPIPGRLVQLGARMLAAAPKPPFMPPAADWVEAVSHPAIMDDSKAREQLGFNPRYSSLEALRDTLRSAN